MRSHEQTKLTANAVNIAATPRDKCPRARSCLAIGALAPVAALYGAGPAGGRGFYVFIGAVVWITVAGALHLAARRILRGLRR